MAAPGLARRLTSTSGGAAFLVPTTDRRPESVACTRLGSVAFSGINRPRTWSVASLGGSGAATITPSWACAHAGLARPRAIFSACSRWRVSQNLIPFEIRPLRGRSARARQRRRENVYPTEFGFLVASCSDRGLSSLQARPCRRAEQACGGRAAERCARRRVPASDPAAPTAHPALRRARTVAGQPPGAAAQAHLAAGARGAGATRLRTSAGPEPHKSPPVVGRPSGAPERDLDALLLASTSERHRSTLGLPWSGASATPLETLVSLRGLIPGPCARRRRWRTRAWGRPARPRRPGRRGGTDRPP